MTPETRRIPDEEWERHKARILELYRERKLQGTDGVIEMMEKEGFVATPSQYELRFRKWGISKNVKQRHWELRINGTHSSSEVPQTITTISESRQRRAQRRYRLGRSHENQSVLPDGSNNVSTDRLLGSSIDANADPLYPSSNNGRYDSQMHESTIEPLSNMGLELQWLDEDSNAANSGTDPQNLGHVPRGVASLDHFSPLMGSPFWLNVIPDSFDSPNLGHNNDLFELQLSNVSQLGPAISRPRYGWLKPSPSNELIYRMIKGIHLKSSPTKTSDPDLLFKFTNALNASIQPSNNLATLPKFEILYSRGTLAGEDWNQWSHLSDHAGREACLDGRLIASIINGFAGLHNQPAAGVVEFLNRHSDMQQVVIEFLHTQSTPMAKAFAENLLLASLEADNVSVVQYLLGRKLVDETATVYLYAGKYYTVFEIAIIKRSYEVIDFFMNRRPELCLHKGCNGDALELLIMRMREYDPELTLEDRFLRLANILLEQGCTVTEDTIGWTLSRYTDPRLGTSLAHDLASKAPDQLLMKGRLLHKIVTNLEEDEAMKIIQPALEICEASDDFRHLFRLSGRVDDALDDCIERGHDELSRILLPFASNPVRRLSDAIGTGKQMLVDVIMQHNPDLYQSQVMDTTAFIAALRSGDETRLGLLEQGVFNHLRGRILGHALSAALEAGNLQYATKLVELDPDFEFVSKGFDVSTALDYALAHDFSSIAWKLLAAGVMAVGKARALMLDVAMRKEKADFVGALIEFDPQTHEWDVHKSQLVASALACNNDTIFSDVWAALPAHFDTPEVIFLLTLRKGHKELFLQMFECSLGTTSERNALLAAVTYEDPALLNDLVSLGAKADDEVALHRAVQHPSMVEPLLEHYWKAYPQGRPGYGRAAVLWALKCYSESPQILDSLFRWNLVGSTKNACGDSMDVELIFAAIRTRKCDIVKKFIRRGADIDAEIGVYHGGDRDATTALLEAIRLGFLDIVRLLLDSGADVNKPARFRIRRTPLQKAAEMDDIAIVRLLLDNGADVNAAPAIFIGATALQLAAINGNRDIAAILIERGARHDVPPPIGLHGRWPLEGAAENGRFDMIKLLWDADQRYFEDERCHRAMRLAERNGHIGCKELVAELMAGKSSTHLHTLRAQTPHLA